MFDHTHLKHEDQTIRQEDLVERIKQAYIQKIRALGSPFYNGGARLDGSAVKAAEICAKLKANPEVYVDAQYKIHGQSASEFYPTMLHTRFAEKNYEEHYTSLVVARMANQDSSYAIQVVYLKKAVVKTTRPLETILMDDKLPFTPWFRICISKEVIPAVLTKYGKAAKELWNKDLSALLKKQGLDVTRVENL